MWRTASAARAQTRCASRAGALRTTRLRRSRVRLAAAVGEAQREGARHAAAARSAAAHPRAPLPAPTPLPLPRTAACGDDDARAAYFLQLWTLKESYVKALGRGISAPPGLRSFSFCVAPPPHLEHHHHHHHQKQHSEARSPHQQLQEHALGVHARVHSSGAQSSASSGSSSATRAWDVGAGSTCNTASSSSSSMDRGASTGSSPPPPLHAIHFASAAPEPRGWQFALLQPSSHHVAALSMECGGAAGAPPPLRVLCFEAEEQLGDAARAAPARLLGRGCHRAPGGGEG